MKQIYILLAISIFLIGIIFVSISDKEIETENNFYTSVGITYSETNGFSPATSTAFPKPEGKVIRIFSGGKD